MCNDKKKCNVWISLRSVGIESEGCLRDKEWLENIKLECRQSIFQPNIYINLQTKKLKIDQT